MRVMNNVGTIQPLRGYCGHLVHPILVVILGVGLITDLTVFGILGVRPVSDPTNPERRVMVVTHPDRAPWLTDLLTTWRFTK